MEGPIRAHPPPFVSAKHRRTASRESLEVPHPPGGVTVDDRQHASSRIGHPGGGNKEGLELAANSSSAVSSCFSRDSSEWFRAAYNYQHHNPQTAEDTQEDHDNSHDSGTASTTLCSSSPSSSPSPSMLTQGPNTVQTGNNMAAIRAGLPPPPPPQLGPGGLSGGRRLQPLIDQHSQENSYAEIPYGSLPLCSNNFDHPPAGNKRHLVNPSGRNDWKTDLSNNASNNTNLVHNLHMALDYGQAPGEPSEVGVHAQNHNNNHFRTLPATISTESLSPADRQTASAAMIHLRDGPDGLFTLPQPRMATMDLPSTDYKSGGMSDTSKEVTSQSHRKRKSRQTLIWVVVMALAGVAYLALGGMAGYYYGKTDCEKKCTKHTTALVDRTKDNDTMTYAFTTMQPGNTSAFARSSSMTPSVFSTTVSSINPTTLPSTVPLPTTPPPPQYCKQVGNECVCGPYGGDGGKEFNDHEDYLRLGNITGFAVKHNEYFISGLQMQYGNSAGAEHGYTEGGFKVNVQLLRGEHITKIEADFTGGRGYLSRLLVHTDRRVLGPYGGQGSQSYPLNGAKLLYVLGRSGPLIDQLGFVFDKCTT